MKRTFFTVIIFMFVFCLNISASGNVKKESSTLLPDSDSSDSSITVDSEIAEKELKLKNAIVETMEKHVFEKSCQRSDVLNFLIGITNLGGLMMQFPSQDGSGVLRYLRSGLGGTNILGDILAWSLGKPHYSKYEHEEFRKLCFQHLSTISFDCIRFNEERHKAQACITPLFPNKDSKNCDEKCDKTKVVRWFCLANNACNLFFSANLGVALCYTTSTLLRVGEMIQKKNELQQAEKDLTDEISKIILRYRNNNL